MLWWNTILSISNAQCHISTISANIKRWDDNYKLFSSQYVLINTSASYTLYIPLLRSYQHTLQFRRELKQKLLWLNENQTSLSSCYKLSFFYTHKMSTFFHFLRTIGRLNFSLWLSLLAAEGRHSNPWRRGTFRRTPLGGPTQCGLQSVLLLDLLGPPN